MRRMRKRFLRFDVQVENGKIYKGHAVKKGFSREWCTREAWCGIDIKRFQKHNFLVLGQLVIIGPGAPRRREKKERKKK